MTAKDTDIIWIFDIPAKAGIHRHDTGHASILIHGDYLYLNSCNGVDGAPSSTLSPEAPSLIVLEKSPPADLWPKTMAHRTQYLPFHLVVSLHSGHRQRQAIDFLRRRQRHLLHFRDIDICCARRQGREA